SRLVRQNATAGGGTETTALESGFVLSISNATGDVTEDTTIASYDSLESDDMLGTPSGEFTLNEIHGQRTAVLGFTIRWHDLEAIAGDDTSPDYDVAGHWWTQQWDIDPVGNATWTVSGSLVVRATSRGTTTSAVNRGNNPDTYRTLVLPQLPQGYRIESEKWATDESATRLIYTIVAKQYAKKLPAPGKTGDARFIWRRAINAGPEGGIGIKFFEGELEAADGVSAGQLIQALVNVAA
ncbi:unnamed protein product, partial [marine sediment metagenome]